MKAFLKMLFLVASSTAVSMPAFANSYVYTFSLNGAGADPPNSNPGVGFATLTLTDPDSMTVDITYSQLSSDVTKVLCWFGPSLGNGVSEGFEPLDLPPSGHSILSRTFYPPSYMSDILHYLNIGEGDLQVGTVNYPIDWFGEIGGVEIVPEPSSAVLPLLAVSLGLGYRISLKSRGDEQPNNALEPTATAP
jgi:hypothetical protein